MSRRVVWLLVSVLFLAIFAPSAPSQARRGPSITLAAPSQSTVGRVEVLSGRTRGRTTGFASIQTYRGGWRTLKTVAVRRSAYRTRVSMGSTARTARFRVVLRRTRAGKALAHSSPRRVVVHRVVEAQETPETVRVPGDEVIYGETDPASETVRVALDPQVPPPAPGTPMLVPPTYGVPGGFIGKVESSESLDGETSVVLAPAALDEVFDKIRIDQFKEAEAEVVDEDGYPVYDRSVVRTADGGIRFRDQLRRTARGGLTGGIFECEEDGVAREPEDVYDASGLMPINVEFTRMQPHHTFVSGLGVTPSLSLGLAGTAVVTSGFEAKTTFDCELSPTFRRNHRLRWHIGMIGPVPVNVTLEPALKFSVGGGASFGLSQEHRFFFSVDKVGNDPMTVTKAFGRGTPHVSVSAELGASLFLGGDLAVMFGGGYRSANAQAGLYGEFGPQARLAVTDDKPGCVQVQARMKAALGVRLELWAKRWDYALAEMSNSWANIIAPRCGLPDPTRPSNRARLTWDDGSDVDLHVWDEWGNHTWYGALDEIYAARLLRDVIDGYGPEDFVEDDDKGRGYTFGVCLYDGDDVEVNLTVTDPDGTSRPFSLHLQDPKDAALVTSSGTSDPYVPDPGWCGDADPVVIAN